MSKVDLALIQKLRERTAVGMMDCKKALEETNGDIEAAVDILRKKGAAIAQKRSGNVTREGLVHAYIHPGGRLGVMVEIQCETDFVARTDEMKRFAHDLCIHIVSLDPRYIAKEQVTEARRAEERARLRNALIAAEVPLETVDATIVEKIDHEIAQATLLEQFFVKNDQLTVNELLQELIAKMGESIKISRFSRFELGKQG